MSLTDKAVAEYAFDLQVGLEGVDVPEYDIAKTIGMAAVLAVNLRGLGEIQYQSLRLVAAHYFHIRSDVLDGVLQTLAELELVKLVTTGTTIQQVIPTVPHFEWPAPGSEDTELGVLMEPEVDHGEAEVYARVQA